MRGSSCRRVSLVSRTRDAGVWKGSANGVHLMSERDLGLKTSDQMTVAIMKMETERCSACDNLITDRYLLKVSGRSWHARCLRCTVCQSVLDRQPSCFIKEDNIYCKADYIRQFGAKCAKCSRSISASDWVRRARELVYHLACFACDSCKRQLSTGEEFALQDNRVLCKTHYMELLDGGSTSNDENNDHESQQRAKSKRVRTTFTDEQLQVLQANFSLDSNPDGQDLERIAQITGLSKRVTQVWFQNSRARQKKHQNNAAQAKRAHGLTAIQATACPGCGMMYCLCNHSNLHLSMGQVH